MNNSLRTMLLAVMIASCGQAAALPTFEQVDTAVTDAILSGIRRPGNVVVGVGFIGFMGTMARFMWIACDEVKQQSLVRKAAYDRVKTLEEWQELDALYSKSEKV